MKGTVIRLGLIVWFVIIGYAVSGESDNLDLLYQAKGEKDFNDRIIAGDMDTIEQCIDYSNSGLTYEQRVEVVRICALNSAKSVDMRVESDRLAFELLQSGNLFNYLVIGMKKVGLHLLAIIENDYAKDRLIIIDNAGNTAISRIDSKGRKFIAAFLKNQAPYLLLGAVIIVICYFIVKKRRQNVE